MQFIVISSQLCYEKLKWNTWETSLLKLTLIALQVHHRFDWRFYEFKTESNIFCKGSLIPSSVQPKCPKLQNREHVFLNNWFFWAQWSFGPAEAQLALTKPQKTQKSSLFWTFLNSIHYLTKEYHHPINYNHLYYTSTIHNHKKHLQLTSIHLYHQESRTIHQNSSVHNKIQG